jgi:hypothetical protein
MKANPFVFYACITILPVLAAACAAPATQIPATTQPALSTIAQPYGAAMRRAGIQSVQVFANGARVRVATNFGELSLRYPAGLGSTAFAVYVDPTTVEVDSDTYTPGDNAQYEAAMKSILPETIKSATDNNTRVIQDRFGKN